MKARSSVAIYLIAFVGLLVLFGVIIGGCAVSGYNQVVGLDESVDAQLAEVDNHLKRRYDLIPNLVATVKGYASHEKEIFENIAQARTQYFQAGSRAERVNASNGLERALSRLLVLQENYPDLKANESFLRLQDEVAGTENRLRIARTRYNESVRALNAYRRGFFGRTIANWADVDAAEYFEVPEQARERPKISFDSDSGSGG